jgi:O-antigen ligase
MYFLVIVLIVMAAFFTNGYYYKGFISYFYKKIYYFSNEGFLLNFVIIYIFYKIYKKEKSCNFTPIHYYVILFIIFYILSIIASLIKGNMWINVLWDSRVYLRGIIIFLIVVDIIKTNDQIDNLLKISFLVISLTSLFAFFQQGFITTPWEVLGGYYRTSSTMFHPNIYAGVLEMIIPIAFAYFLYANGINRIFYIATILLSFFALIFTFSRGGFIGALLGCSIVIYKIKKRIALIIILLLLMFIFVNSIFISSEGLLSRQLSTFKDVLEGRSLSAAIRYIEYRNMWITFKENPLFGFGWGGKEIKGFFNINTYETSHYILGQYDMERYNDQLWLDLAHKGGIFLPILITIILFYGIWMVHKATLSKNRFIQKTSIGILGALIGFMSNQLYDNFIRRNSSEVFFWIFFAIGIILYFKYIEEKED